MDNLEDRMDQEISQRNFSFLEMAGFSSKPLLAVKAGVAIGYKMALEDIALQQTVQVDREKPCECNGPGIGYDYCGHCGGKL